MNLKILSTIFLLSIVVFFSGCLQGGGVSQGYGIEIKNFGTYYPKLESGDDFDITVDVQNKGGTTANNIYAYLYGISPSKWRLRGSNPTLISNELQGPDEEMDVEGESDFISWNLVAPELSEGVTFTYNPKVRVFYTYETTASTSIPILSRAEYKRLVGRDKELPKQKATQVTKGPIGVEINTRSPVIARGGLEDFRIVVKVKNLMGGGAFHPDYINSVPQIPEDRINEMKIKIEAPDVTPIDCSAYNYPEVISLRRGIETVYNCELGISNVITRRDVPINVKLTYGYFLDETTEVTVKGVE